MDMAEENPGTQGQGQPRQTARTPMPRRSGVYKHFTDAQGENKYRCKHCDLVVGANTRSGTSNLWKHVNKKCKGRHGESSHPTSSSLPQAQLQLQPSGPCESSGREPACMEQDEASRDLARLIALHGYDPSVVEDDYFKSFVRRLNPQFEVPSREAIEEMCSNIFEESRRDQYRSNKDDHGKVSFAVGEAKTIETRQVVYVTTHFIDHHWNLHRVVDLVYMVSPAGDCYNVPFWGVPVVSLGDAVDRIVHDSPYLVDPMFNKYELFMVAGEMTGHINPFKLKDCMEQGLKKKIISATYMDHVLHSIARCLLPDSNFAKNILEYIDDSHIEGTRKKYLAKFGLLDDPWEYDEWWYSCYCFLKILEQAYPLDSDEEECTEQLLRTLWREIYRAIKRVSHSSRPTSNLCLQELFKVRDVLQSQLSKTPEADNCRDFGSKNVADVLREALEIVHKAIKDSYLVWSIPLILDPRYKLRYIQFIFERAFGSEAEKYVSEIRTKTKELYSSYIEDNDEDSDGSRIEEMAVDSTDPLEQAWDEQCRSQDKTRKVDSHAQTKAELECYLEDRLAPRTEDFNILGWWKQNSAKYPTVAQMARDALAMPTCSNLTSDQMAHIRSMIRGYRYELS